MRSFTFKEWKKAYHVKSKTKNLIDFLHSCEDVCWGENILDVLNIARDYQESNDREFDEDWALDNIEQIDGLYVLWEYSEAWQ